MNEENIKNMEEQTQNRTHPTSQPFCLVCGASEVQQVLTIQQIPVLANVLWDHRVDALSTPRGDIQLLFCLACGHVFNQTFKPDLMEYDAQYENSLHFSPRFQKYADWLAHYLIDRYEIREKKIIEIGSGKGDFLRMLCEYGSNTGTGFDPSFQPDPLNQHPAITFVKDLYSERYVGYQADLVFSRHVLEHIYQPASFVQTLRRAIGPRMKTVVFCEVPNFGYIVRDTAIWDIIYEHISYFSKQSLAGLFSRNGFRVLNVTEAYDEQFLLIEAMPDETGSPFDAVRRPELTGLANQVNTFAARSQEKIAKWNDQLRALRDSGKRAVLWGAGSKGISFLNILQVGDAVEYIVDINPRKNGKYVTGAGQQIVSPEFLTHYHPDYIIIMNPIYQDEIREMTRPLGLHVDFLNAT